MPRCCSRRYPQPSWLVAQLLPYTPAIVPLRWANNVFRFTSEGMVRLTGTEPLAGVVTMVICDGCASGRPCPDTVPTQSKSKIAGFICKWRMSFVPAEQEGLRGNYACSRAQIC